MEHNPGAVSLSTDEYFICDGEYRFDPDMLADAHLWNQKRGKQSVFHTGKIHLDVVLNFLFVSVAHIIAKEAFERGKNPIIIDNTNMQGWEMRPYVAQVSVENLLMVLMWSFYLL